MPPLDRDEAFELIQSNIDRYGHHIYLVAPSGPLPRWAYTIGLDKGGDLVLAGASAFLADDVERIINECAKQLDASPDWSKVEVDIPDLGAFQLRQVEASWIKSLLLGATDFYGRDSIQALQIVPDKQHWTIDVPDLSKAWDASLEPVWQWLHNPWMFDVLPRSTATTNLAALRGERVTEAARWEEDQWELFAGAGPDVPKGDLRVVPLGTLLAADMSIVAVAQLHVGGALWRDQEGGQWEKWG